MRIGHRADSRSSGAVHPIAALRRLPGYPLEAFFWSRLLISEDRPRVARRA
jgi:hypothetical protein